MLETSWLRVFALFAEKKNFTHAARALALSQPAVFAQVQKLSEAIGTELYRKAGRSLVLTEAGERVAAFARKHLDEQASLVEELRTGKTRARVVVCAGEGAYLYLIGEAIESSVRDAESPVELLVRDSAGTLEAVRTGAAHLGVLPLVGKPPGLVVEPLARVSSKLVMPADHRLARASRVRLSDLSGLPLVAPPAGSAQRAALEEALAGAGAKLDVAVEVRGWPLTLHFVKLGAGLAIVNSFCRLPKGLVSKPIAGLPVHAYAAIRLSTTEQRGAFGRVWKRIVEVGRKGGESTRKAQTVHAR